MADYLQALCQPCQQETEVGQPTEESISNILEDLLCTEVLYKSQYKSVIIFLFEYLLVLFTTIEISFIISIDF